MPFEERTLGRTGLRVARLGLAASYGVPAAAIERAFEHGVNYLYWGSLRREAFAQALRNLAPRRDRFVLVIQSYSRFPSLLRLSLERALRKLRMDHADILLLGMWNKEVSARVLDAARALRERGLVRFLAVSTHHRPLVPQLAVAPDIGVFHFRYNAAHPGAEADLFPHLPATGRPGMVAFTATSWGQLLKPSRIPRGERVPTASDCYRFVLARPEVDVCLTGPANAGQIGGRQSDRCEQQQARAEADQVEGDEAEKYIAHHLGGRRCQRNTKAGTNPERKCVLSQHAPQNVQPARAQRHADSKLGVA